MSDNLHQELLLLEPLLQGLRLIIDEARIEPHQIALEALVLDLLAVYSEEEGLSVEVVTHQVNRLLILQRLLVKVLKVDVVWILASTLTLASLLRLL